MTDIYSISFAIYFIFPPFSLFIVAYLSADVFVIVGELMIDDEIRRERAVTAMGIMIGCSAITAGSTYFFAGSLWSATVAGSIVFYASGVVAFATVLKKSRVANADQTLEATDLARGLTAAAILTVCTVFPLAALVLLAANQ